MTDNYNKTPDVLWHEAAVTVSKQVVQIIAGNARGTGFITHCAHDLRGIATAFHVIREAIETDQAITIRYGPRKSTKIGPSTGRELILLRDKDKATDVALLLFKDKDAPSPPRAELLQPHRAIVVGVELGWIGFPAIVGGEAPCFFSGRISFTAHDGNLYLVDGTGIKGVSGGPVFYLNGEQPEIIGVVSAYTPEVHRLFADKNSVEHYVSSPGLSVMSSVRSVISRIVINEAPLNDKRPLSERITVS